MKFLFIVGYGSKHDNLELRYSLRSIEKYGTGIEEVYCAGQPPSWFQPSRNALTLDFILNPGRNRNIQHNVVQGVKHFNITEDFILGIDDVFLLRKTDFALYPRYIEAYELPRQGSGNNGWKCAMVDTGRWLRAKGYPSLNFMTHAHCRLNGSVILRHFGEIEHSIHHSDRGLEIVSQVGNITLAENPKLPLVLRRDNKLGEVFDISGIDDCFSISDKTFSDPRLMKFLESEYPNKSRWED